LDNSAELALSAQVFVSEMVDTGRADATSFRNNNNFGTVRWARVNGRWQICILHTRYIYAITRTVVMLFLPALGYVLK